MVDGGNPFGPAASIAADGSVTEGGASRLTGYSVLKADSLHTATTLAKDCPILTNFVTPVPEVKVYKSYRVEG